jgi:hypothetical protein
LVGVAIAVGLVVVVGTTGVDSGALGAQGEQLAAGEDPFPPPEPAPNCVGFCFNATIDSVNEENRRLARVVMIGKKGKRTPALVERTSILSSSRGPAAEGEPVRFACYDRFRGEDGLRFESCSQMATLE